MKSLKIILLGAVACQSLFLLAEDLELTADRTVFVEAGQIVSYDALTGGEFTLTKTGGGTLEFAALANPDASIVLEGGTLKVAGKTVAPAALAQALLAVDAGASAFKDSSGKAAAADYAGQVSDWGNLNGLSPVTASRAAEPFPTRLDASQTVSGLPLVDFGSQSVDKVTAREIPGYGGYMSVCDISSARPVATNLNDIVEVMIVGMDTEDVKTTISDNGLPANCNESRATPFVGSSEQVTGVTPNFARGNRSANGVNSAIQNESGDPFLPVARGAIVLDGETVSNTTLFPDGLHLLEYRPTRAVQVSFLAAERRRWRGGVRLGAVALFATLLSEADRTAVRRYLMTRWVPVTLKRLELGDGTTLAFENAAGIHARTLAYSGESALVGGTLTCDAEDGETGRIVPANGKWRYGVGARGQLPSCARRDGGDVSFCAGWYSRPGFMPATTPWFHVDASDAKSLTTEAVNGTNFVTSWVDADGGAVQAKTFTTDVNRPFLRTAFLRGRNVVDYGAFSVYHATAGGWGGAQQWVGMSDKSKPCDNVREVLTVAADTEDLVTNHDNILASAQAKGVAVQASRGAPFLGGTSATDFLRGNRADLETGVPILLSTVAHYATMSVQMDGADVARDAPYPDGFHLVDIRTGVDGCIGNAFARDRSHVFGGTRIAEFYVFTSELSDADRRGLTNKLMAKWLGAESTDVVTYGNLTVDAAAHYSAGESRAVVSNAFCLAGQMEVSSLEVHGRAAFAANAGFAGRLKLVGGATVALDGVLPTATEPVRTFDELALDGGTVTVDFCSDSEPPSRYVGKCVPLFKANRVTGEATFVAGGALANRETEFEWREGVLCATVKPNGTILIFR